MTHTPTGESAPDPRPEARQEQVEGSGSPRASRSSRAAAVGAAAVRASGAGREDRPGLGWALRHLGGYLALVALAVVVGVGLSPIGASAVSALLEPASSSASQSSAGAAEDSSREGGQDATPLGNAVLTADGLEMRVAGSFVKPGAGQDGDAMRIVVLETRNEGDGRAVLRKDQFSAVCADGKAIGSQNQTISLGGGAYHQFTSTAVDRLERVMVCFSFRESSRPVQLAYEPWPTKSGGRAPRSLLDIGDLAIGTQV